MVSPTEISEAIIAALILAMGIVALASAALRRATGDRTALWFGIVGCLYGARLAGESQLLQPLLREATWRYLSAFITYAIIAPLGLFIEALVGPGWHRTVRLAWQGALVYSVLAMANDLARRQPGATLWLNAPMVLIAVGIGASHILARAWKERWPREFRVPLTGGFLFVAVAIYQTLGGSLQVEHYAMLVFMASLGYLVAQRALTDERRLVAVSRELDLARRIQRSILPKVLPSIPGLRIAARYLPMAEIGGDFYDFDCQFEKRMGLIVADVSGHGVPAALVASMVKIAFGAEADQLDAPGRALANINRTLCGRFSGVFVTACCAAINARNSSLSFACAGHPGPWLRHADGRVERLAQSGLLLAFDPKASYAATEVQLHPGDRLLFFSDGLLEASNARDEFFGEVRLEPLLVAGTALSADQFLDLLTAELRLWIGPEAPFQDDITIVVIDISAAEAHP
jgi:sigma-B regulation protein RsbU (phosphoserine phosphatase)